MKIHLNALFFFLSLLLLSACGEQTSDIEAKKNKLSEIRTQALTLKAEIAQLENEIAQLDPEFGKNAGNVILVSTTNVIPQQFEHKIEVRGAVESKKNVLISAEIGGRIESIKATEGQRVSKGQILVLLDADIIRNNIAELKTSLDLANIIHERQSNLWEKKIGTEIQYLESKNAVESLERRLTTVNSQLAQATVRAPFSGSIDEIPVKVGEMATPGLPLVRIVNPNDMYIKADVSENYIGKFNKGEAVDVHLPAQNQNLISRIASVSQVINKENRTFSIEVELSPVDFVLKPNQVSILKLKDYQNDNAFVVPTKLIQRDDKGTFVYITATNDNTVTAQKLHIETGLSFNSQTEIISGLKGNEVLVDQGFRDVTEGVEIQVATAQN